MMLTQRTSCHRFPSGHRAHATIYTSLRARKSRCCQTQAIQAQCNDGSHSLVRQVCLASIPLLASVLLSATALASDGIERDTRVFDGARIIGVEKAQQLDSQLASFEERTGWRLRVFTSYGRDARPSDDTLREVWQPDGRTVIIDFDTSNPNLTKLVHLGDQVLAKLRRPWWAELQSRFGNLFFIREQGEQAAVLATLDALTTCLERTEGCKVVPGLAEDLATSTVALSVAGGLVAGAVTLIEPAGFVKARWQWLIVFSPLWVSLFINLGLGPVLSRTDDPAPLLVNLAAFLLAAASPYLLKAVINPAAPSNTGE